MTPNAPRRTHGSLALLSLWLACVVVVAACSSSNPRDAHPRDPGEAEPAPDPSELFVRIVTPTSGQTVEGVQQVELELPRFRELSRVSMIIDSDKLNSFKRGLPTYIETRSLTNGPHTMRIEIEAPDGRTAEDSVTFTVDNPDFRMKRADGLARQYGSTETIDLLLTYDTPGLLVEADFKDIDGTLSPVVAEEVESGRYRLRHTLGTVSESRRELPIRATGPGGRTADDPIPLALRARPMLPITVDGMRFADRDGQDQADSADGPLKIESITGISDLLVDGLPTNLVVHFARPVGDEDQKLIVRVDGYSGYYYEWLEKGETSRKISVSVASFKPAGELGPIQLLVGLQGKDPRIDFSPMALKPVATERGGVRFFLRWDRPADLDLEVTAPDGSVVGFESPESGDGKLDVDANSLCELSPVNVENIAWAHGKEPSGQYEVRVNLYDACGETSTDYELVVEHCDTKESFTGTFDASDADVSGAGRVVATVDHDCTQRVSGTVSFEKPEWGQALPFRTTFAPVRVVRTSDGQVLASGVTDQVGNYSLAFSNRGSSEYHVEVEASWADPELAEPGATVAALSPPTRYSYAGAPIDGSTERDATSVIEISRADGSGAFNIADTMGRALDWVNQKIKRLPPPLRARWSLGLQTPGGGGSYKLGDEIFIGGLPDDPDEFDDSVIAHEVMHYVVAKLSATDTPGGAHEGQIEPRQAWDEGLATLLGQAALGSALYGDAMANGGFAWNLDTYNDPSAFGTSDGTQNGWVNEDLISIALWDLIDSDDEATDHFQEEAAVLGSVFDFIPAHRTRQRGARGVDLVDFLDGFRCTLDPRDVTSRDVDLKDLLDDVLFPYDFAVAGACS